MSILPDISAAVDIDAERWALNLHEPVVVLARTRELLAEVEDPTARQQLAVLNVCARADAGLPATIDSEILSLFVAWAPVQLRGLIVAGAIADINTRFLEDLLGAMLSAQHPPVATLVGAAAFLHEDEQARIWLALASDLRNEVREHFFALLGRHEQLVPPGTLNPPAVATRVLIEVLSLGLKDATPTVRERAIAVAYGLGWANEFRDELLRLSSDESTNVAQYALVALGAMRDEASLAILLDRLERGQQEETTSAIWALSRRPDGIERVLRLVSDPRAWVQQEVLGAFAEVSVPLTDDQIAMLDAQTRSPVFRDLKNRHLERTRGGAPERGPEARLLGIRRR